MKPAAAKSPLRPLAAVVGFQLLLSLPFLGKAVHLDEPCLLAMAGQVLRDPLRPAGFDFRWNGRVLPMREINPNPPLAAYLLAPAAALANGREWILRALVLPAELAAAAFLYLLAARFLSFPLLPVLIALAGPGYWINIHLLLVEKWIAAFGFAALYALARALDDDHPAWWGASALLCALALLCKYSAVFLVLAGAAWALLRGAGPRRVLPWAGLALAPAGLHLLSAFGSDGGRLRSVLEHSLGGGPEGPLRAVHRLRALLAFAAGCAPALALWPWRVPSGRTVRLASAALPAAGLRAWIIPIGSAALGLGLMLPALDLVPTVRQDRLLGAVLCAGSAAGFGLLLRPGTLKAGAPWVPWALSVAFLQAFAYWSVVSRYVLFLSTPMTLALAGMLERSLPRKSVQRLYLLTLGLTLALGGVLAWVDARYAGAQRLAASRWASPGHGDKARTWFTGHWGLQYYMERAGARGLEAARGGWGEVRPGDRVIVPAVNTNLLRPPRPLWSDVLTVEARSRLPLRLMCGAEWRCQAGFHSSDFGFLPFSFSLEPLDRFQVIRVR